MNSIEKVFDLKGSKIHRLVVKGENQTLKDRNLLACKDKRKSKNRQGLLQFDTEFDIKHIKTQLKSDSQFLKSLGLLDYSLLLAVEKLKDKEEKIVMNHNKGCSRNRHRFVSTCGNYVYHLAVIDMLTRFNLNKRMESYYKVHIKNNKEELVSCVNPDLYSRRFYKFLSKDVIINEDVEKETDPNYEKIKLFAEMQREFDLLY